ncbi:MULTISPECIES: hypothetical protein [Streptomyces]|uniref:hypothetical protein n=1 Tax=Streptomyces TaxID=1883 RepID=UPI00210B3FCA|nr:hypothetical protein [Streptomyces longispororuber]MCQ4209042.1 hypothetical protein [Streptomyces longispororuber]
MPRPTHRTRTRPAAPGARVLWGALLMALLVSVLGVPACAATAPQADARAVARVAPATPGCDPEQRHAPDGRQGVPSRGTSAHELLAPLVHEHGLGADATFDGTVPPTPAGRGPPPHDPPSPVELSVLRV